MLKEDEVKYMEVRIKKLITSIEYNYYQKTMNEDYDEDWPGWTMDWIGQRLGDLYYLIIAYLEGQQMHHLLRSFKFKFEPQIISGERLYATSQTHPEGDSELDIINGFKQILEVFKGFDYRVHEQEEVDKLSSILRNTGHIIKNIGKEVKREADIYKEVKWIIGLYYPQTRLKNKTAYINEFKCYNPDILVPELKTAIEYKYIDDVNDNIDEFIDQVKVDATNYVDDPKYNLFYAVIYIEDIAIATPESIQVAWDSKGFPDNWKLILAGHTLKTI